MREIIVRTLKEVEVPVEALHELRKNAFAQWEEVGLDASEVHMSVQSFGRYIKDKVVFVAHDAKTGELLAMHTFRANKRKHRAAGANLAVSPTAKHEGIGSRMLEAEVERFRKAGYRYLTGATGIPAVWSVNWHLKNGYYITGYKRNEKKNYASYTFRKPIALDIRHHPMDIFWTRSIAPYTARVHYIASYIVTCLVKNRSGKLTPLGRVARSAKLRVESLKFRGSASCAR